MANEEVFGAKFEIDATDLKSGITDANRYIRMAESEFKAAASGMDDWKTSEDGLNAKMKQLTQTASAQEAKVKALQSEQSRLAEEYGDTSSQAEAMQIRVNNATTAFNKTQKEIKQTEQALDGVGSEAQESGREIADAGDKAEKSGGKFGKIGGAAKAGVAALAGAAAGIMGTILGLSAASEETVEDMGKLDTAFTTSGHSAETAQSVFNGMVGVLGETDQAVEASNHLAKLTQSQEELSDWTTIAAGVYGTFGDSLPLEGLTEAANETAKVGQVTGPFADTLNWATMSAEDWNSALGDGSEASKAFADAQAQGLSAEDAFNAALATTTSESERASMVTNALTGLYGEAGEAYQKVNGDLIASRQAQADMNQTMAEAGQVVMPLRTMLMNFAGDLLSGALPGLQQFGDGLKAVFSGDTAAGAQQMADGISSSLESLVSSISAKLPAMLTAGVSVVNGLVQGVVSALPSLVAGLAESLPMLITGLMQMVTELITSVSAMLPTLLPMIVQAISSLAVAFVQALPALITALIGVITQLAATLPTLIPVLLDAAVQLFLALVQALPQIITALMGAIPNVINAVLNLLPTFLPMMIQAAVKLFIGIVKALPQILAQLIPAIGSLIGSAIASIPRYIGMLLSSALQLFTAIVDAVPQILGSLGGAIRDLLNNLPSIITGFAGNLASAAGDMLRGMVQGIQDAAGAVWDAITNVCNNALDAVKGFFGIASPSKLMRKMFGYVGEGAAIGITDKIPTMKKAMKKFNDSVKTEVPDDNFGFDPNPGEPQGRGSGRRRGGAVTFVQNNYSPKALDAAETYRQGLKLSQTLAAEV